MQALCLPFPKSPRLEAFSFELDIARDAARTFWRGRTEVPKIQKGLNYVIRIIGICVVVIPRPLKLAHVFGFEHFIHTMACV